MQIPEATRLPIRAEKTDGFVTTSLYSMPKATGIYRRVSRDGRTGIRKVGPGNTLAIIPLGADESTDALCELQRWTEGELLLRPLLPGIESPISDEPGNPMD